MCCAELARLKRIALGVEGVRFNFVWSVQDDSYPVDSASGEPLPAAPCCSPMYHVGDIQIHWEVMHKGDKCARPTETIDLQVGHSWSPG